MNADAEVNPRADWDELTYWCIIEANGGALWSSRRALGRGRPDITGLGVDGAAKLQAEQVAIANELSQRFGIILPQDMPKIAFGEKLPDPPEGKRWYWDWYNATKALAWGAEYKLMICSACPFSRGLESMVASGGRVPCNEWRGLLYQLRRPYECAIVEVGDWSRSEWLRRMAETAGEEVLVALGEKEEELKEKFAGTQYA